jgi:hypothetical protein
VILLDKIYSSEEQRERASKALKLTVVLVMKLGCWQSSRKPTIIIKRLSFGGFKLKSASSILKHKQGEREKAEKATTASILAASTAVIAIDFLYIVLLLRSFFLIQRRCLMHRVVSGLVTGL